MSAGEPERFSFFVNGTELVGDGHLTDARSGQLLRSGRHTETVTAR